MRHLQVPSSLHRREVACHDYSNYELRCFGDACDFPIFLNSSVTSPMVFWTPSHGLLFIHLDMITEFKCHR